MAEAATLNLILPGNQRYQPAGLKPYFGYDRLYRGLARVEIATLQTLGDIGFIPAEDMALLTREMIDQLLAITTTEVDKVERGPKGTRHDVRAWVRIAQGLLPPQLGRWVHVPLTSYDPLDTGRILTFIEAYHNVVRPALCEVI